MWSYHGHPCPSGSILKSLRVARLPWVRPLGGSFTSQSGFREAERKHSSPILQWSEGRGWVES